MHGACQAVMNISLVADIMGNFDTIRLTALNKF